MRFKVPFVSLLVAVLSLGLVAASAQASDAGLKKVIKAQEKKLKPMLEEFDEAGDQIESSGDFTAVKRETADLRKGFKAYRAAVSKTSGSTADGKKARTKLLAAIKEMDAALGDLETFFEEAEQGDKAGIKAAEKKFDTRSDKAEKLEDQALKLLGLPTDD